jgi:hypothetical protein
MGFLRSAAIYGTYRKYDTLFYSISGKITREKWRAPAVAGKSKKRENFKTSDCNFPGNRVHYRHLKKIRRRPA